MANPAHSQSALPTPMRFLSLLRRLLLWASLVFAFVGVVASIDALQKGLRSPENHLDTTVGTQVDVSLPFHGRPDLLPSDFSLLVTPQTSSLVGQNFAIGKKGEDVLVTLHALPSVLPGSYEVRLLANGNATDPWTVHVHADKRAMQKASLSYLESLFGFDPLNVTVLSLGLFLFSLVAGFLSHRARTALCKSSLPSKATFASFIRRKKGTTRFSTASTKAARSRTPPATRSSRQRDIFWDSPPYLNGVVSTAFFACRLRTPRRAASSTSNRNNNKEECALFFFFTQPPAIRRCRRFFASSVSAAEDAHNKNPAPPSAVRDLCLVAGEGFEPPTFGL